MFAGPEYVSYVALCRELRLERNAFEYGDVWTFGKAISSGPWVQGASGNDGADAHAIWLPRLDQWLAMLEEVGVQNVGFQQLRESADFREALFADLPLADPDPRFGCFDLDRIGDIKQAWPYASTREEAAARLWVAVARGPEHDLAGAGCGG